MDEVARFSDEVKANIDRLLADDKLQALSHAWLAEVTRIRYTYNFTWLGRPVIQLPQDLLAVQELIWQVQPDLVVETGVAHGGSLIHSASVLELLGGDRLVVGVDVDIRAHNRREIEGHPLSKRIRLIEGSSTDARVAADVREHARGRHAVLAILDSDHTHAHVLRELELYAPLITRGSYLIVFDTLIEDLPDELFAGQRWGRGNNPKTAVRQFLTTTGRFEIDARVPAKLLLSCAPDGYLRCVGD
ncbi:MAG TPA: cephalosporin hydroxylase family protein [Methylomirabilota bacterium]|nr:cephalosporin hydroxylase family protein [Methylomirabilota bacterium]